mgnify:CR=1 FL=1
MEDVKAQLALLTRVVTDLQKVVLELKAEISALRSQSSLPKAVEPLKTVETPPATATSGLEIPDEPWTDAEAKTHSAAPENNWSRRRRLLRKRISLHERRSSCSQVYLQADPMSTQPAGPPGPTRKSPATRRNAPCVTPKAAA